MADLNRAELLDALDAISPEMDYEDWVQVGMALHHEGCDFADFDAWSARDTRPGQYKQQECMLHWRSFENDGRVITGKYIFKLAYEAGWHPERSGSAFGWNDMVAIETEPPGPIKLSAADVGPLPLPEGEPADPVAEVTKYLTALFRPDEHVAFNVTESAVRQDDDGKWKPASKGCYYKTCGQLVSALENCNGDMSKVFGTPVPEAGAWVRINPLDGGGVSDTDVTAYRYALIECDEMEPGKQWALIKELRLPCAAVVTSGGKSVHAIVHVDAPDRHEYIERVRTLYKHCKANGLPVDEQNRNPSRLSRLPGFQRGDKWQRLVAVNIGCKDWDEWRDWLTGLPEIESLGSLTEMPELAPELIHGVLRDGQKGMLTGPSKAGKSFLMIELAIAVARGWEWLGFKCEQGRVLYVNFEIQRASFLDRIAKTYRAMKHAHGELVDSKSDLDLLRELDLIDPWNLRGRSAPLDQLAGPMTTKAGKREGGYRLIILDPIYKLLTGDENSASDMARLCNQFDAMAEKLGAAVFYAHHHAKGPAGARAVIDRGSGSGVFARDPDALIDMSELELADADQDKMNGLPVYRIEFTLRDFESPRPLDVAYRYPLHKQVAGLESSSVVGAPGKGGRPVNTEQWGGRNALVARAVKSIKAADMAPTVASVWAQIQVIDAKEAKRLGITQERLADWTKPSNADTSARLFDYMKGSDGGLIEKAG